MAKVTMTIAYTEELHISSSNGMMLEVGILVYLV